MKVRPPVVGLVWLLACLGLSAVLSRAGLETKLARPPRPTGVVALGAGGGLITWALGLFRRHGTTFEPFGRATALVVSGPYRLSRNPMYLGMVLVLTGLALLTGRWPVALAPAGFYVTMDRVQIPAEEAALAASFGEPYRAYQRRVRRWL